MAAYILRQLHALECVEKLGKTLHEYYALPWEAHVGEECHLLIRKYGAMTVLVYGYYNSIDLSMNGEKVIRKVITHSTLPSLLMKNGLNTLCWHFSQ